MLRVQHLTIAGVLLMVQFVLSPVHQETKVLCTVDTRGCIVSSFRYNQKFVYRAINASNYNFLFHLQSLVTPNGLIAHLFGPMEGKRHDAFMLSISGLTPKISRFNQPSGAPYVVYGDPAYGLMRNIMAPYRGAQLTAQQQQFNKSMSAVRISVEWTFGKICQYFTYVDLKRNNKVLLQPIGKYYAVAALLTNCHTCMYGSMTSKFFNVDPPSLESYLFNL